MSENVAAQKMLYEAVSDSPTVEVERLLLPKGCYLLREKQAII
jgi:hypothetical protein